VIRDSPSFLSSRESVVGAAVGDVVANNTVVAASKGSPLETLVYVTVRNLDLTKLSLRLSVRRKATRGTDVNTLVQRGEEDRIIKCFCMIDDMIDPSSSRYTEWDAGRQLATPG